MGRPPGSGKLGPHVGFFRELVAQDLEISLFELRDALVVAEGIRVRALVSVHGAINGW